jgi:hypothetical protein
MDGRSYESYGWRWRRRYARQVIPLSRIEDGADKIDMSQLMNMMGGGR